MYGSGFKDTAALSFANLYMYGGGFDMAAALLHRIIRWSCLKRAGSSAPLSHDRPGRDLATGASRRRPARGLSGAASAALCPTFYGHMFMNPKDAPLRWR